jgi:hypothetical protein
MTHTFTSRLNADQTRTGLMTKTISRGVAVVFLLLASTSCSSDRLVVPNMNNPTPDDLARDPIAGLQLAATGILRQNRLTYDGFISDVGIFGRESFDYFPTDGRSHTHYVAQNPLDRAGFTSGGWATRYVNRRNIVNFLNAVENAALLSAAQKEGARGFAKTMDALELHYIVNQRFNYGAVIDIKENPRELAPFVSRDSVLNYVVARLEEARGHLASPGAAFPFQLHAGYTGFTTPATFLQFNRAVAARVEVWRASLGLSGCGAGGVTCYQRALTALGESFLDRGASLSLGPTHVFSTDPGDIRNALNEEVDKDLLAHPSIETDAPRKADGSFDARFEAKVRRFTPARGFVGGPEQGIETALGFKMYPMQTSPAPFLRNEELVLVRAEARYFTGDVVGALDDINFIRTTSGGLAPRGPFVSADDFITELLLQRRYSLLWEGHRWMDVRRFGRITTLPLDKSTHFRQSQQPIPQAECLQREGSTLPCPPALPGP